MPHPLKFKFIINLQQKANDLIELSVNWLQSAMSNDSKLGH